jgi:hypothetical protein
MMDEAASAAVAVLATVSTPVCCEDSDSDGSSNGNTVGCVAGTLAASSLIVNAATVEGEESVGSNAVALQGGLGSAASDSAPPVPGCAAAGLLTEDLEGLPTLAGPAAEADAEDAAEVVESEELDKEESAEAPEGEEVEEVEEAAETETERETQTQTQTQSVVKKGTPDATDNRQGRHPTVAATGPSDGAGAQRAKAAAAHALAAAGDLLAMAAAAGKAAAEHGEGDAVGAAAGLVASIAAAAATFAADGDGRIICPQLAAAASSSAAALADGFRATCSGADSAAALPVPLPPPLPPPPASVDPAWWFSAATEVNGGGGNGVSYPAPAAEALDLLGRRHSRWRRKDAGLDGRDAADYGVGSGGGWWGPLEESALDLIMLARARLPLSATAADTIVKSQSSAGGGGPNTRSGVESADGSGKASPVTSSANDASTLLALAAAALRAAAAGGGPSNRRARAGVAACDTPTAVAMVRRALIETGLRSSLLTGAAAATTTTTVAMLDLFALRDVLRATLACGKSVGSGGGGGGEHGQFLSIWEEAHEVWRTATDPAQAPATVAPMVVAAAFARIPDCPPPAPRAAGADLEEAEAEATVMCMHKVVATAAEVLFQELARVLAAAAARGLLTPEEAAQRGLASAEARGLSPAKVNGPWRVDVDRASS